MLIPPGIQAHRSPLMGLLILKRKNVGNPELAGIIPDCRGIEVEVEDR